MSTVYGILEALLSGIEAFGEYVGTVLGPFGPC